MSGYKLEKFGCTLLVFVVFGLLFATKIFENRRVAEMMLDMAPIEEEFVSVAKNHDCEILQLEVDYGGALTNVLEQRDSVLLDHHCILDGIWWVDAARTVQISRNYHYNWWWWLNPTEGR